MRKQSWMNVYRSGFFHREGKPNTLDRHAGDLYDSEAEALRQIFPKSHYIATVPVEWDDPEDIKPNPPSSIPVPLSVSRRKFAEHAPF